MTGQRPHPRHVPDTYTPDDGLVIVDCSCGSEYIAVTPHGTLDVHLPAEESAALRAAHERHVAETESR